ncbi:Protein O-mannosyltransferase 2 [Dipsacomyces acuminosporus]|nr:Protein O-mannosyltransferase 2 [Dipsacomyces acuminosporus]
MEARNIKQRSRHLPNDASTLPLTAASSAHYEYSKDDRGGKGEGLLDAYPRPAHGASRAYAAAAAFNNNNSSSSVRGKYSDGTDLPADFWAINCRAGLAGLLRSRDLLLTVLLTAAALLTRLYRIGRRNQTSWDEAHFGKFGAYYINRTFYHDVHPPLAKMLVALAEVVAGHNGSFTFKSGQTYPAYVNYTLMRIQVSLYGVALVPLAYLTCLQLRLSRPMAALAACFVLFDNAICVMSKFILLDEPLLFFTALTLWSAVHFQNESKHSSPFSHSWWKWLLMTGFSLGCVMSSKWVGFFCVLMVGIATVDDLFRKYCSLMPWREYGRHWSARIVGLIVLPLLVYTACFWVHFTVLNRSGSGDFKMPASFQANLKGNKLNEQPYDITYGAFVDIRAVYNGPGLLHSHVHRYPSGSRLQQVTCFPHRDFNNVWQLRKAQGIATNYTTDPIEFVNDGDIIQLAHNATGATIRASNRLLAPLTTSHFEVAAENITATDAERLTNWRVEIVKQKHSRRSDKRVHAMTTVFRMRHVETGCLMRVGPTKLPAWGWRQSEVTCLPDHSKKKDIRSNDVLWFIEHNKNKRMQKDDLSKYVKTNFVVNMVHLNIEMGKTNNALSPDRDKYNALESDPWSWPFLIYPMRMVGWGDKSIKYYEIGNVLLWFGSSIACITYPLRLIYYLLRMQRKCSDWSKHDLLEYWDRSKFLFGGWALHYIPFFLMQRVLYIHHYLPALYFALLQLAFDLDHFFKCWRRGRYIKAAAWCIGMLVGLVFLYFSPFTYGYAGPAKDLASRRWLSTWNIDRDLYAM